MFDFKARIARLQRKMRVDCVVLAQFNQPEANALYYSGIEEPLVAYVTEESSIAFTEAEGDLEHFEEVMPLKKAEGFYKTFFRKNKIKSVGLDFSTEANRLGFKLLEQTGIKAKNYADEFDKLRALKDPQEQRLIKKAQEVTK